MLFLSKIDAIFNEDCQLHKAIMKHCIRIRTVCGAKVDVFSGTQIVANHPEQQKSENQRSSLHRGIGMCVCNLVKIKIYLFKR